MNKRFIVAAVALVAAMPFTGASIAGQGRGQRNTAPAGPVPRTAEGKPDFTGVYTIPHFEDITGALAPGSKISLTPYGAERRKTVDLSKDPNARCLPWGPTRMVCCTVMPLAFVQHKDVIAFLTESQQTFRLIYTDGRDYPKDLYHKDGSVDRQVGGWFGFSIGHWDGDTLVVETKGVDDRNWIDGDAAHEHSSKMLLTERFTMVDANTIKFTGVITDPVFYTEPITFNQTFNRAIGDRIMSHACAENEQDSKYMGPTPPGVAVFPPPPAAGGRGREGRGGRGAGN
jgi:hypothetical protein